MAKGLTKFQYSTEQEYKEAFGAKLIAGLQSIREAGALLVEAEAQGFAIGEGFAKVQLETLRGIGRQAVLPELYFLCIGDLNFMRRLSGYPLDDQRAIVNGKRVPLIVLDGDGKQDKMMVLPADVIRGNDKKAMSRLFSHRGVRSEQEQVQAIKQEISDGAVRAASSKVEVPKQPEIKKHMVTFPAGHWFSKKDIADVLTRM